MGVFSLIDSFVANAILTVGQLVQLGLAEPLPVIAVIALAIVIHKLLFAPQTAEAKELAEAPCSPTAARESAAIEEYFRKQGASDEPHEEAVFVPGGEMCFSNASHSTTFTNENCVGEFLSLHRATHDRALDKSGKYPYGEYFKGKKRIWEARVHIKFTKKPPRQEDMFFGTELREYVPMNTPTKGMMATLVRTLKGVVGNQIYHSPGDDPEKFTGKEIERPLFVMPLWAFDQFIVTPVGKEPPDLCDPNIPNMGVKRSGRVAQFRKELSDLEFEVGPTYTFCFWGISQWLDKFNCTLKVPMMGSTEMSRFFGRPPMRVVIYTLADSSVEKRHVDSRKSYFLNVEFWSSKQRPDAESIRRLLGQNVLDGLGDSYEVKESLHAATRPPGPGSPVQRRLSMFACCTAR